jgi:hypothetical protein
LERDYKWEMQDDGWKDAAKEKEGEFIVHRI